MSAGYSTVTGRLRHRLTVQNVVETRDEIGANVVTYENVVTMWGSVVTLSGNERVVASQIAPRSTHKIRMRYLAGLTVRNRLKFGDRLFQIEFVNNVDQRNKILEMLCVEDGTPRGDSSAI